jgi:choline dehydrogenase-like flavoprotein
MKRDIHSNVNLRTSSESHTPQRDVSHLPATCIDSDAHDVTSFHWILVGGGASAMGVLRGLIEPYCNTTHQGRLPFTIVVLERGGNDAPPIDSHENDSTNLRHWYHTALEAPGTAQRYVGHWTPATTSSTLDKQQQQTLHPRPATGWHREIVAAVGRGWGGTTRVNAGLCIPPAADDFDTWWPSNVLDTHESCENSESKSTTNDYKDTTFQAVPFSPQRLLASVVHLQSVMKTQQCLSHYHSSESDTWASSLHMPHYDDTDSSIPAPVSTFPSIFSRVTIAGRLVGTEWRRCNYYQALIAPLVQHYPQLLQHVHFYAQSIVERLIWSDESSDSTTATTSSPSTTNSSLEGDAARSNDIHRVVGVQVRRGDQLWSYYARCEVIVCAGAIESPALLLVSGIGQPALNVGQGKELHHLPVGQYLQDHVLISTTLLKHVSHWGYASQHRSNLSPNSIQALVQLQVTPTNRVQIGVMDTASWRFILPGVIVNSIPRFFAQSTTTSTPSSKAHGWGRACETMLRNMCHFVLAGIVIPLLQWIGPYFLRTLGVFLLKPVSTGSVTITPIHPSTSTDIRQRSSCEVHITWPYFTHNDDVLQAHQALVATAALWKQHGTSLLPSQILQNRDALRSFLLASCQPYYHWSGSCRMKTIYQTDTDYVVDEACRVQHCQGVRVCDASIFPTPISAPPALTCAALGYMLACQLVSEQSWQVS